METTTTREMLCRRAGAKTYHAARWSKLSFTEKNLAQLDRTGFPAITVNEPRRSYLYVGESGDRALALDVREPSDGGRFWIPVFIRAQSGERLQLVECSRKNDIRRIMPVVDGDFVFMRITPEQALATIEDFYRKCGAKKIAEDAERFGSLEKAKIRCQTEMLVDNFAYPTLVTPALYPLLDARGCMSASTEEALRPVPRAVHSVFLRGVWPLDVDPAVVLREDDEDEIEKLDAWVMPKQVIATEEEIDEAGRDHSDRKTELRAKLDSLLGELATKLNEDRVASGGDDPRCVPTETEMAQVSAKAAEIAKGLLESFGIRSKVDSGAYYVETLSREEVDDIVSSIVGSPRHPVRMIRITRDGHVIGDEQWAARRRDSEQVIVHTENVPLRPEVAGDIRVTAEWVGVKLLDDANRALSRHMFALKATIVFDDPAVAERDQTNTCGPKILEWCETEGQARAALTAYIKATHEGATRAALIACAIATIVVGDPNASQADKEAAAKRAVEASEAADRE